MAGRSAAEEERIIGLVLAAGAIRASDLRLGTTGRRALTQLLREQVLLRTGPVIHMPDAQPAVIAARRLGGVLTCAHALPTYDLPELLDTPVPHVAVPANRGHASLPGAVVHRERGLAVGPGIAAPLDRVLARLLRCAPEKEAIAVVDNALNRGLLEAAEIAAHLTGRGNRCPDGRRRLARCTAKARSPIESIARVELEDAGHTVAPGVVIPGVGEVDLLVDGIVIVETDGYAFHSTKKAWTNDRRRDQELLRLGRPVIRLTYEDVMGGRTVALVEAAERGLGMAEWEERFSN